MARSLLLELLKRPASDSAQLALALWGSLSEDERDGELVLSDAQRAGLDRRWAEHLADPSSPIPWAEVRSKLLSQMTPWSGGLSATGRNDASEVQAWYESRGSGLGREFALALDAGVERIAANPLICHRIHGEIRRAVLSRFRYAIYFRPGGNQIVVSAIHGRRHPSRWRTRSQSRERMRCGPEVLRGGSTRNAPARRQS